MANRTQTVPHIQRGFFAVKSPAGPTAGDPANPLFFASFMVSRRLPSAFFVSCRSTAQAHLPPPSFHKPRQRDHTYRTRAPAGTTNRMYGPKRLMRPDHER